jgi:hypothetical protein
MMRVCMTKGVEYLKAIITFIIIYI